MPLVLTNTLSGRKEPLVPRVPGKIGLYWCGVTVFARSHIGHARALVTADVLYRYLRARGLEVTFVRNFTDIDDKIIKRAAEEGITPAALTEREITTNVLRGENSGRTLVNDHVVRRLEKPIRMLGKQGSSAEGSVTFDVDPSWRSDRLEVVAFVQDPMSMKIVGAAVTKP